MNYDHYEYLWPPRPEQVIPPSTIPLYEAQGWMAQVKKNGTCTVIFTDGEQVIYKTRHNDDHKAWTPKPEHDAVFKAFAKNGKWCVLVAELLHSKGVGIKDTFYVFDLLVLDGEYLIDTILVSRLDKLYERFNKISPTWYIDDAMKDHYSFTDKIWLAVDFYSGFKQTYDNLTNPEDEGLVFKNPNATLKACVTSSSNSAWQVKCRKATKNYGF